MFKNYIIKTIKIALFFSLTILFVRSLVLEPGRVNGVSMEPNFIDAEVFLVNKFALLFNKPQRGQVVQIFAPSLGNVVIKRIVGLPGEQIIIRKNSVYVTGTDGVTFRLEENYLPNNTATDVEDGGVFVSPVLKKNQYFLLGDNRGHSTDSRYFGGVSREHIFGTVIKLGD